MKKDFEYRILNNRYSFEFIDYKGDTMNIVEIDSDTDNVEDIIKKVFITSKSSYNSEFDEDFDIVFKSVRLLTRSTLLVK